MARRWLLTAGLSIVLLAAAPPPAGPIARWIEDLASDDPDVWRRASEDLWHTGFAALPALRAARKSADPDVALRAGLVAGKLEWGIRPETPPAVVAEIGRFREGDEADQKTAVERLTRLGGPGFVTLRRLLAREPNAAVRQRLSAHLQTLALPAARDLISRGELDEAERVLSPSLDGSLDAARDLAAFWWLSGRASARLGDLERDAAKNVHAARMAALVRRAAGDLTAARMMAGKATPEVLAGVLGEQEDYNGLARMNVVPAQPAAARASLAWRTGDRTGFDAVLDKLKPDDHWTRANLLFEAGRVPEAITVLRKVGPEACHEVLTLQGRLAEVIAMTPPREPEKFVAFRLEQAVVAHRAGGAAARDRFLEEAQEKIEAMADKGVVFNRDVLGWRLGAGRRIGRKAEALTEIGRILNVLPPAQLPYSFRPGLGVSSRDGDALSLWWECLRERHKDAAASATLTLLDGWFVGGKADKDFDTTVKDARGWVCSDATRRTNWPVAVARACERVGRLDVAEDVLKEDASRAKTVLAIERLGEFFFARKRWADAAAAFGAAMNADPTRAGPTYLRGVALVRAGEETAGRALIARTRLLPLADEERRYSLARTLEEAGLDDEAGAEWLALCRVGAFASVYVANANSSLAHHLDRKGKHAEAARCHRLLLADVSFGAAGSFTETGAYLRVPGHAHWNESLAHIDSGKPDQALAEARRLWLYLPENKDIVIDLVRAFEKAGRPADADRLFDEQFALMQRACVELPRCAERHNRLAWVAARTGRRLDVALRHARYAVESEPTTAGYQDTLAELHFQRGDKTAALMAIDRAIALEPKKLYFAQQRRRIEAGTPKAAVPKE